MSLYFACAPVLAVLGFAGAVTLYHQRHLGMVAADPDEADSGAETGAGIRKDGQLSTVSGERCGGARKAEIWMSGTR